MGSTSQPRPRCICEPINAHPKVVQQPSVAGRMFWAWAQWQAPEQKGRKVAKTAEHHIQHFERLDNGAMPGSILPACLSMLFINSVLIGLKLVLLGLDWF